jgi:hypothetical protein
MTIDVGAIRASGRLWGDNYALLRGNQIVALCDALDAAQTESARLAAERDKAEGRIEQQDSLIMWQGKALEKEQERVRVLRAALRDAIGCIPDGCVPIDADLSWLAALAATDGGGAG